MTNKSTRNDWEPRALCPDCGWHYEVPNGKLSTIRKPCCPTCDLTKNWWVMLVMRRTVRRFPFPVALRCWNPLTWECREYHWEVRA